MEIPPWQRSMHRKLANSEVFSILRHQLRVLLPLLGTLVAVLDGCKVRIPRKQLSLLQDTRCLSGKSGMWCKSNAWHCKLSSPRVLKLVLRLHVHEVPCVCWQFVSSSWISQFWIWTIYTTFHMLWYRRKILSIWQYGMNEFPTLCAGFIAVEIIKLCYMVPCGLKKMGCNILDLCSNLVPVWVCNIQLEQFLQHTSFKIFIVHASNARDLMLFCCIAVFQHISIIYQCGALANAFAARHVAQLNISKSLALINSSVFHRLSCISLLIANTRRTMSVLTS